MPELNEEDREWCLHFVSASERYKAQFVDRWREVLASFMVEPEWRRSKVVDDPYHRTGVYRTTRKKIILKDPETHKIIASYVAKLMKANFGDGRREYVRAEPVGWEDAVGKAPTVSRLLRYVFSLPGHYRTFVEAYTDMLMFGTSVVESPWYYREMELPVRTLDGYGDTTSRQIIPVYDDVCLHVIDLEDFFPDPSHYRIQEMTGCAKRFRVTSFEASGYSTWDQDAVQRAFAGTEGTAMKGSPSPSFREGLDQPADKSVPTAMSPRIAYQYWGQTPHGPKKITVLNSVLVESEFWPHGDAHLPFHAATINPVVGRFFGVAPAEVIRYDQSFADAIKILLAEAIIRQVHPPIAVDDTSDVDTEALREWKADAVVTVKGGIGGIGTLKYDANIQAGFAMLTGLQGSMQAASGNPSALYGEEGPDREAATVGAQRYQQALSQPELAARLLEEDFLPDLARGVLRRYQQFSDDQSLIDRLGELPTPTPLAEIMGDYDIRFVGSRMAMTRQQKLQSLDRMIGYSQVNQAFALCLPSLELARWAVGELLELPEVAANVGTPETVAGNAMALSAFGQGAGAGNGNGTTLAPQPAGMGAPQAAGSLAE